MTEHMRKDALLAGGQAIPLTLEVALPAKMLQGLQDDVALHLGTLLEGLGEDLGVRFAPDLTVEEANEAIRFAPFRLSLNGQVACVPRLLNLPEGAKGLANLIFSAVLVNRALLVNEAMVSAFGRDVTGEAGPRSSQLRRALEIALARFLNVAAARLCFAGLEAEARGPSGDDPELDYATELTLAYESYPDEVNVEAGRALLDAGAVFAGDGAGQTQLAQKATWRRADLATDLGLLVPPLRFRFGETLEAHEFRVQINHVRGPVVQSLTEGERMVEANSVLDQTERRSGLHPLDGRDMAIVPESAADGFAIDPVDFMVLTVQAALHAHAAHLCSVRHAENLLARQSGTGKTLVLNLMERQSITRILHVFRALLAEGVSLRNMGAICQSLLDAGPTLAVDRRRHIVFASPTATSAPGQETKEAHSLAELVEAARQSMKAYMSFKHSRGSTLVVLLLDPEIEGLLMEGKPLPQDSLQHILETIADTRVMAKDAVVLTTTVVRATFRSAVSAHLPQLPVLAYEELSPDTNIQPIERITLS